MPYGFYMAFGFIGLRPFGVAYNCRDTWQGLSEIDNELKMKLEEYINNKNIDYNIVKKYLPLFPDKIYKNLYNGGLINELV